MTPNTKSSTNRSANNSIDIVIGRKLKTLRRMRGMTQTELADALQITFQQVQKYEGAKNRISASRLIDVARVLDVDVSELLPETTPQIMRDKPTVSRQAAQLIQGFETILDQKLRGTILTLVKKLAQQDAQTTPR